MLLDAYADAKRNVYTNCYRNRDFNFYSYRHCHGKFHTMFPNRYSDSNVHAYGDLHANGNSFSDIYPVRGLRDRDANADFYCNIHTYGDRNFNGDCDCYCDRYASDK